MKDKNSKEKKKTYRFYVINIKIRKTDSKKDLTSLEYQEIFRDFYNSFTTGKSSKQKECLLISHATKKVEQDSFSFGKIVQATLINNKKWFNRLKNDIDKEFKIPKEYTANASITEYVFIPKIHRFCYRFKSLDYIAPYSVKSYFQNAFDKFLHDGYFAQIDVESDPNTIDQIYRALEIKSLDIEINYSNNDFGDDFQKFVEDDLKESNVGEIEIYAKQKNGNSIEIERSRILGGALQSSIANGEVTAKIIDEDGKRKTIKTKDNPLRIEISSTEDTTNMDVYNYMNDESRKNNQAQ